jgi:hypothetical protein
MYTRYLMRYQSVIINDENSALRALIDLPVKAGDDRKIPFK